MNTVKSLIDKAAKLCGSEANAARRIGTSPQALSDMKHGKREMSPETAALLADIANEDARQAVIDAVIERNKTGPKAELIRQILGKVQAAGVAGAWLISLSALISGVMTTPVEARDCKNCSNPTSNITHRRKRMLSRALRRARDWVKLTPRKRGPLVYQ